MCSLRAEVEVPRKVAQFRCAASKKAPFRRVQMQPPCGSYASVTWRLPLAKRGVTGAGCSTPHVPYVRISPQRHPSEGAQPYRPDRLAREREQEAQRRAPGRAGGARATSSAPRATKSATARLKSQWYLHRTGYRRNPHLPVPPVSIRCIRSRPRRRSASARAMTDPAAITWGFTGTVLPRPGL